MRIGILHEDGKAMTLGTEDTNGDATTALSMHRTRSTAEYDVLLSYEPVQGRYRATIPDLPGFKCEAATAAEAKSIVRDAVSAWIQRMRARDSQVPEPTEHTLETIEIPLDAATVDDRTPAQHFALSVSTVFTLTEEARREFLVAESAVLDDRFPDATRHVDWCIDLLVQAGAVLEGFQPRGELERVHKLLEYGIDRSLEGARAGLQGIIEQDVEVVRQGEEFYIQGMESTKSALAELRRFVTQP